MSSLQKHYPLRVTAEKESNRKLTAIVDSLERQATLRRRAAVARRSHKPQVVGSNPTGRNELTRDYS